jgi:hypothetical protein
LVPNWRPTQRPMPREYLLFLLMGHMWLLFTYKSPNLAIWVLRSHLKTKLFLPQNIGWFFGIICCSP